MTTTTNMMAATIQAMWAEISRRCSGSSQLEFGFRGNDLGRDRRRGVSLRLALHFIPAAARASDALLNPRAQIFRRDLKPLPRVRRQFRQHGIHFKRHQRTRETS